MSLPAQAPIGIFDSGMGGLSVLRAVRDLLPNESLVYLADARYAPYGERDDDFIADRTQAACDWLATQGAKAIVVACNTATAQTIDTMRQRLQLPLVGVEPGIKPAAAYSKSGVAGVLATASTLRSARFARLLADHAGACRFICTAGHGLVEAIERGETDTAEIEILLRRYLEPMLASGADTLVLGCTHYPFLSAALTRIAAGRLALIDTGAAIARQLDRKLTERQLHRRDGSAASYRFCSTGGGACLESMLRSLMALPASVEHVVIESRRTAGDATAGVTADVTTDVSVDSAAEAAANGATNTVTNVATNAVTSAASNAAVSASAISA